MIRQLLLTVLLLLLCTYSIKAQAKKSMVTEGIQRKSDSISFVSQPSGYKMAGTISYPLKKLKCPAMILIAGSGPHTRQENISKTAVFDEMAAYFNQLGFVVLRIDKRGFGLSQGPGSEDSTTSEELADDIYAALQFLKTYKNVDLENIGLVGHSEGAWIAEMVALRDTSVKWLALLGAHVVSGALVQEDQMASNLARRGAAKEVIEKVRPQIKRLMDFVVNDINNDSIFYAIGKDFLLAHGVKEENITTKFINQLLGDYRKASPWNRYFFGHSPSELIRQLNIPVLFLYGANDNVVSPSLNLLPLVDLMEKEKNDHIAMSVLSNHDHFFLHYNGKTLEKHKPGEMHVSTIMLDTIRKWLQVK